MFYNPDCFKFGERVLIEHGPHIGKTGILVETADTYSQFRVNIDDDAGTGQVDIPRGFICVYPKRDPMYENFGSNVMDENHWALGQRAATRVLVETLAKSIAESDDIITLNDWIKVLTDRVCEMRTIIQDRMDEEQRERDIDHSM
jgi:hypothetical protein